MASISEMTSGPSRTFYSVGIDETAGLKDKIADVHGDNSRQVGFISELEDYLGDSDEYRQASQKFKNYVRRRMNISRNTDYMLNEFINSGYIMALERIRAPNSGKDLDFLDNFAKTHDMTSPQVILFGSNGTARQAFSKWMISEALRGQHRSNCRPDNEKMAHVYDRAFGNTYGLPRMKNKLGEIRQSEIDSEKNTLPAGINSEITKAFGRHRQLYQGHWYRGTKRLSGDLPYQIIEAMSIELLDKHSFYKSDGLVISRSKLEETIEKANENRQNAFRAIYELVGKKNNILKDTWNESRKILNDYAEELWQQRNTFGEQMAKRAMKVFPGTIYLNNGRYYWLPKHDEKAVPLIPEKAMNKIPGSLFKNDPGGYFWWIPRLKFRRRMVSDGDKVATRDLKTAQKLQRREWEKIQQYEPQLAAKLKNMRRWGVATRYKPTAVKIAKRFWSRMQDDDPAAVERIMSDKRPEKTKPDMNKVWPSWSEQKARLKLKENKPYMPIVYPGQAIRDEWKYGLRVPEKLEAIVGKIKKVDWMVANTMLIFDDNSPAASSEIAIQSRGRYWTEGQYQDNKKCVIRGSASIDKDLMRIGFTVYNPGYTSARTLAEEVYHVVFEIIRLANPQVFGAIQAWYKKKIWQGSDVTFDISEAFSQAMAQEEIGYRSNLPRAVVKYARRVISNKNDVKPDVMAKVRTRLAGPY